MMSGTDEPIRMNGNGADGYVGPRVTPYDYLITMARYKYMVGALVVVVTGAVALYSFVMPQTFTASTVLLPPDKSQGPSLSSLLASGASGGGGLDISAFGENPSSEVFVKILSSRTLGDSLVSRFGLMRKLGLDESRRQIAIGTVMGGFDVTTDRTGMITITYNARTGYMPSATEKDSAALRAAAYANAAVEVLDKLNREKSVTRARRSREYIGRMLVLKRAELDTAQYDLLNFQTRNRAVSLDRQVEASVNAVVELQTQIQKKELEIGAALNELNPDTRLVENLRSQLSQLKSQRSGLETGASGSEALSIPLRSLPELGRQYANLKLNLEVATQVYTFLEAQYNQEQVQEARDLPTVAVLDTAVPPLEKSAPRRVMMILIAFLGSLFAGVMLAFVRDFVRRRWRPTDEAEQRRLAEVLRLRKGHRTSRIS